MRSTLPATLFALLIIGTVPAHAGSDLNEVGAFLVFPSVVGVDDQETLITITNAGSSPVTAHIAYINGDEAAADYCYECDFSIPLTGNDTEVLIVTRGASGGIEIQSEPDGVADDNAIQMACPHPFGMITVNLEDDTGAVISDNVLFGEQVVVNYAEGFAYSVPAITMQGGNGGDGDRSFRFDDREYGKMPRIVAGDFIAPDISGAPLRAELTLFTLGFERQFPPDVDCSVTGYDADENPFSRSFRFGCWTTIDLCEISPEFCYPNLGQGLNANDTHGWFQLNCRVDSDDDGTFDANGGVHGAIVQFAGNGAVLRKDGAALTDAAAWGRLLYQSVTTGDPLTLQLNPAPGQIPFN